MFSTAGYSVRLKSTVLFQLFSLNLVERYVFEVSLIKELLVSVCDLYLQTF